MSGSRVCAPRSLLDHLCEALEVRILTEAFDQQVSVVGHQAVREDCELFERRSTSELRERLFSDLRVAKH
jgi:hypothetical protein